MKKPSTLLVPSPKLRLTSKNGAPATFKLNTTASGANPEAGLAEQVAVRLELGDVPLSSQLASPTSNARPAVAASRGKGFIALEGIRPSRRDDLRRPRFGTARTSSGSSLCSTAIFHRSANR